MLVCYRQDLNVLETIHLKKYSENPKNDLILKQRKSIQNCLKTGTLMTKTSVWKTLQVATSTLVRFENSKN